MATSETVPGPRPAIIDAEISGPQSDRLLTVPEVAERLRLNPETIRRMLRDGRLAGFRIGADNAGWRVTERDLAVFVQTRIAATESMR